MKSIQKGSKIKRLEEKREKIIKEMEFIARKMIRGKFQRWYQVCTKKNCKCHKNRKDRHGPYYRISYFKGKRAYHVYISENKKHVAKRWTENYNRLWKKIEALSQINIQLLKRGKK